MKNFVDPVRDWCVGQGCEKLSGDHVNRYGQMLSKAWGLTDFQNAVAIAYLLNKFVPLSDVAALPKESLHLLEWLCNNDIPTTSCLAKDDVTLIMSLRSQAKHIISMMQCLKSSSGSSGVDVLPLIQDLRSCTSAHSLCAVLKNSLQLATTCDGLVALNMASWGTEFLRLVRASPESADGGRVQLILRTAKPEVATTLAVMIRQCVSLLTKSVEWQTRSDIVLLTTAIEGLLGIPDCPCKDFADIALNPALDSYGLFQLCAEDAADHGTEYWQMFEQIVQGFDDKADLQGVQENWNQYSPFFLEDASNWKKKSRLVVTHIQTVQQKVKAVFTTRLAHLEEQKLLLGGSDLLLNRVCLYCAAREATAKFKKCAGCKIAIYCSVQCQKRHWGVHRWQCTVAAP